MNNDEKCPVTGKRKYETEGEALATAAHQIASNDAPKDLRAYRCQYCESWHLTKNTNTGRRKRLKRRARQRSRALLRFACERRASAAFLS